MLVSTSHRFIFFHIGKTGGMSLREVLQGYAEEPQKFKIRRPPETIDGKPNTLYEVWQTLLLHAKARDARRELPKEVFDGFFKFAFVRNPWDLQVSMYHFILREPKSSTHEQVKAAGSFEGYLDWVAKTASPFPKGIPKLQKDMITDTQGNLLVDFVGRYETLARDFEKLRLRLGIEAR
ncbi:MAG: sulfotransferase family 2 domain-containing protein, partial [Methylococcales bacterium]